MPGSERRRQKALQKKAAKRKQKQQVVRRQSAGLSPATPRRLLKQAAHWPLHECLISRDWQNTEHLAQVLVARRAPDGVIAAGAFMIDLGCLGVKSAFGRICETRDEYDEVRDRVTRHGPMVAADLNLAAKVIREALAYARNLGFSPDPDYFAIAPLLEGADPDAVATPVPLGKDGKPFYFAGPYDHPNRIIARLTRRVGEGNFHYVAPLEMKMDDLEAVHADDEDETDLDEVEDEARNNVVEGTFVTDAAGAAGTGDAASASGHEAAPRRTGWRRFLPGG